MGVDENNMDNIEDKEIDDILDRAISDMLSKIKLSLEEDIAKSEIPVPERMSIPESISIPERTSIPESISIPERMSIPESISIPERTSLPDRIPTPERMAILERMSLPIQEPAPQQLAKVLEDLGVQTDAVPMDSEKKMQYNINIQEHARPACSPLHINLSLPPHTCPTSTPPTTPAPVKTTAEPEEKLKIVKNISVQTDKVVAVSDKTQMTQTDALSKAKPEMLPIHINVTMPHTCQPATVQPTPALPQQEIAPEPQEKPKQFKEVGVQSEDIIADIKEDVPPKTTEETTPVTTKPPDSEKEFKLTFIENVSVQTEETAADREKEKPVQYDIKIQEHARPPNSPLHINLNLPLHTCPKSDKKFEEPSESPATDTQNEDKVTNDVGIQTDETGDERLKPVQYKISIEEHKRPATSPLHIILNQPLHTSPAPTVQSPLATPQPRQKTKVLKDKSVQTGENGIKLSNTKQYQVNIHDKSCPKSLPIRVHVNMPPRNCQSSTVKRPSVTTTSVTSQPPIRAKVVGDTNVQNGGETTNKSKSTYEHMHPVHINVKIPPHTCSPSTTNSTLDKNTQATQEQSKNATFNKDIGVQVGETATDNSNLMQTNSQNYVLPDGTPLYITLNSPPHNCPQAAAQPIFISKPPATPAQSKKNRFNDVSVQTGETATDNSKLTQTNYVLPDSTPVQICFNTPPNTYPKSGSQTNLVRKVPVPCSAVCPRRVKCCCHK